MNIITNHFFKKMAGNKKEEDLSSISKMMFMCSASECYIIIYEVSEYIYSKTTTRVSGEKTLTCVNM